MAPSNKSPESVDHDPSTVRPQRLRGNKKLRFGLIGLAVVVVLVGLGWWLLPHKPDLTLRLKIVRTGIENREAGVLFHIEGGEQYQIYVQNFSYLLGKNAASRDATFTVQSPAREFWVTAPSEYYVDLRDQSWRVQADVLLFAPEKRDMGKFLRVIRDAWHFSDPRRPRPTPSKPPSFFNVAKALWKANHTIPYEQKPISDLITNTPPH